MFRKLVATMGMVALLIVPGLASALGLGEIEIHSALNQPMDAEIELLGFKTEEIDEVRVDLASQKVFERVGIPRPYILTRLKFAPTVSAGKPIIRITSIDAVREPFLTFLIDVRWSKGKLLREYTVLLDPPVFGEQARAKIQKPKVTPQPVEAPKATASAPPPKPAPKRPTTVSKPAATRPPATVQPSEPAPVMADPEPPQDDPEVSVKTKRGDTLWSIAERYAQQSGVSVNQMMLAIQDANPDGFLKDNINNLKSGVILRIPPAEAARRLSRQEALAEVRRQWQIWQQGRQLADDDSAISVDSGDATVAPDQAESAKPATSEQDKTEGSKLSILGDDEVVEGISGEDPEAAVQALRKQIALLKENAESKSQENEELADRIQSLESMLKKQEDIISLQNEQLAQLQNSVLEEEELSAEVPASEEVVEDATVAEESAEAPASDLAAETEVESAAGVGEIMQPRVEPLPDFSGPIPEEFLAAETEATETAPESVEAEQPAAEPAEEETVAASATPQEETQSTSSLMSSIMGFAQEQSKAFIGVGAALLLGLLAWMGIRRRQSSSQTGLVEAKGLPVFDDADSSEDVLEDTVIATPDRVDQALDELEEVDDEEEQISAEQDEQAADSDEVLEEADVYISYGLFQQAEDLLKEAIAKDSTNYDYQAKLAEVYHGDNRADEFVAHVEAIEPNLDKSSASWTKIVSMGAALAPSHALFADSAAATAASTDSDSAESAASTVDSDLGLDEEDIEDIADDDLEDNSLDFTFGDEEAAQEQDVDLGTEEIQTSKPAPKPVALDTGLEQELEAERSEVESEELTQEFEEAEQTEAESNDDVMLDFDADVVEDELTAALDSDTEMLDESAASADLDFDADLTDAIELDQEAEGHSTSIEPDFNTATAEDVDELSNEEDGAETAIFDSALFDSEAPADEINEEDTVSLEEVQENLTAELETLSFEGDDIDPGDMEEAGLPTLQTEELTKREMEDIDEMSDNLAASETGTFEADMLAENVTEQFDIGDIDTEMVDLGNFGDDDDLDPPSVIEEVGTKLDLAKAFVDMGDEDAAKETLTEVIEQGNSTQIQEAKDLLDKLT